MKSKSLLQLMVATLLALGYPGSSFAQTPDTTANNFLTQGDAEWAKGDLPSAFKNWSNAAKILKGTANSEFTKRDIAVQLESDGSVSLLLLHPATPAPSAGPAYPVSLRDSGVEGSVTAVFVVKVDGTVDVSSLKIIKSDHPLFTQSLRDALPKLRFNPAEIQGRKVQQLIQRPFSFTLNRKSPRRIHTH